MSKYTLDINSLKTALAYFGEKGLSYPQHNIYLRPWLASGIMRQAGVRMVDETTLTDQEFVAELCANIDQALKSQIVSPVIASNLASIVHLKTQGTATGVAVPIYTQLLWEAFRAHCMLWGGVKSTLDSLLSTFSYQDLVIFIGLLLDTHYVFKATWSDIRRSPSTGVEDRNSSEDEEVHDDEADLHWTISPQLVCPTTGLRRFWGTHYISYGPLHDPNAAIDIDRVWNEDEPSDLLDALEEYDKRVTDSDENDSEIIEEEEDIDGISDEALVYHVNCEHRPSGRGWGLTATGGSFREEFTQLRTRILDEIASER